LLKQVAKVMGLQCLASP